MRETIKKLFRDGLTPEERALLNETDGMDTVLRRLWEKQSQERINVGKEEKLWSGIRKRMECLARGRRTGWLRYGGVAAVVALCIAFSVRLLTEERSERVMYVVKTGLQSVDSVRLADGSQIMLGADSKLTYPETFTGKTRLVSLSGQAFFKVRADKEHPFIVRTRRMEMTVLGTSFEVFSYDTDTEAEIVLLEGRVKVDLLDCPADNRTYIIKPNEKLSVNREGEARLERVNADAYSAWRTGRWIKFTDAPLAVIIDRLEKWYGQKIDCDAAITGHYRFTFTLRGESLEQILDDLSHSAPLNYERTGDERYRITKR